MSYQVLALKYRPQTFDDVVGQPHVTTTLINAIQKNRVAHAMLFTGPRGTGKTTIARILAKALNCKEGPTPFPCNHCKTCREIINGHCADVFEIDGASNNSVDQIRDLRENVTYLPASSPYKIYIIDEVHMLSTAAFNALLKTLEEPPDHVMFTFATTEVHKIPATILSRCQRHDLGRIPLDVISGHLSNICTQEGFSVTREGLDLIAQEAEGSIRDALSLLDRILSSAPEGDISYEQVADSLGVSDKKLMFDIAEAVFQQNGATLIACIETVNDTGLDLKKFYTDIIRYFRNLNVIRLCGPETMAVNLTENEKQHLHRTASPLPEGYLATLLQALIADEAMVKYASHTKTAIETVLLKLLRIRPGAQLDQIIKKLDDLARHIETKLSPLAGPMQSPAEAVRETPAAYPESAPPDMPQPQKQEPAGPSTKATGLQVPVTGNIPQREAPAESVPAEPPGAPGTWQGFLDHLGKNQPFVQALLTKGVKRQDPSGTIQVELSHCSAFDKKRLKAKKNDIQKACKAFLGKDLDIRIISESGRKKDVNPSKKDYKAKHAAFSHPLVMDAQRLFNGEIINYQ